MVPTRSTCCLPTLLLLSITFGCGGPDNRAEVRGTIRVNGQPLGSGSIAFSPTEGNDGPTAGARITNGQYHVPRAKGVAIGKNRVSIRSIKKTGRKIDRYGTMVDEYVQAIPSQYNVRSTLVRDVQPRANVLDFDLKVDQADNR